MGLEQTPPEQVPALWHWSGAEHTTGIELVQVPAGQVSPVVQALASSQLVPLALAGLEQTPPEQVPALWHWSSAEHTTGFEPTQLPAEQVSVCVQASLSSQLMALFALTHPVKKLAEPLAG